MQPDNCSPTQQNLCSDFLPLVIQTLPEKLAATAAYESHYVGKGHEGYETTDHLPVNRGFKSHVGFLSGAETYFHGVHGAGCDAGAGSGVNDMWHDHIPGWNIVQNITYSVCGLVAGGLHHRSMRGQPMPATPNLVGALTSIPTSCSTTVFCTPTLLLVRAEPAPRLLMSVQSCRMN